MRKTEGGAGLWRQMERKAGIFTVILFVCCFLRGRNGNCGCDEPGPGRLFSWQGDVTLDASWVGTYDNYCVGYAFHLPMAQQVMMRQRVRDLGW